MTRKAVFSFLAIVTAMVFLVGCGSSDQSTESKPASATAKTKVRAALKTLETTSARTSMVGHSKIDGKDSEARAEGRIDPKNHRGTLSLKSKEDPVDLVATKDFLFLSRAGSGKWVKVETDKEDFELMAGFAGISATQEEALIDSLDGLRESAPTTVNGHRLTKYTAKIEPKESNSPSSLGFPGFTEFSVWLNGRGQVVKLEMKLKVNGGSDTVGGALTGVKGKGTTIVTIERSEIGKAVDPSAPSPVVKEAKDLSEAFQYLST